MADFAWLVAGSWTGLSGCGDSEGGGYQRLPLSVFWRTVSLSQPSLDKLLTVCYPDGLEGPRLELKWHMPIATAD